MYAYETEEWKKETAELQKKAIESGGGGSNMAEPPWMPPGPVRFPDGLPPEEVARRKKASEGIREMLERAIAHSEAAKR